MSDAAVSITVTSITDFLSFMAGVLTPFPCVKIFCIYSGVSVAFIYVWHVTLFAAFMAISGYAEEKNRHGLFCVKVTPKSQVGGIYFNPYPLLCQSLIVAVIQVHSTS